MQCATGLLVLVLAAACTTDGTPRYPGSVEDAIDDLKTESREDMRRDVGFWLRDRITMQGASLAADATETLSLMKALCDWAVYDIHPPASGEAQPGVFSDHDFLFANLDDRPGVAIAADYGKRQKLTALHPRDFTHYYDREKLEVHPITETERAHVGVLYRLGTLTKFEQATFHGERFGPVASVRFQIGLGTEHHLWLLEDGEWKFLHRIGEWVG